MRAIPPAPQINLRATLMIAVIICCCIWTAADAADSGCKVVFDAMSRAATTPHHTFTTSSADPRSAVSEQIYDGKANYVLTAGKWRLSPMTPQMVVDQERENERESKSVCTVIREESIDGVSAVLYSVRSDNDGDISNGQIWISKASGLPVHIKTDVPSDTRYVFSGIETPKTVGQ